MQPPRKEHLNLMHKWLRYRNAIDLGTILHNNSCHRIAIYGGGSLGELLYEYFCGTDITVACIIDRDSDLQFPYNVQVISPDQTSDYSSNFDAIIVTAIDYFYQIWYKLSSFVECPIFSLDDIIVNVDDLRLFFQVAEHIAQSGAQLLMMNLMAPIYGKIKNPSYRELELSIHKETSWQDYLDHLELLGIFYDDLPYYSEEYIKDVFHANINIIKINDVTYLQDLKSRYFNIINGSRYTDSVPKQYDNTIHFFGDCRTSGIFTEDRYTIESFLQRAIQTTPLHNKIYRVQNHASWQHRVGSLKQVLASEFYPGDLVVLISHDIALLQYYNDSTSVSFYDINSAFDRPHDYGEVFLDMWHVTHKGYRLISDKIYSILSAFPKHENSAAVASESKLRYLHDIRDKLLSHRQSTKSSSTNSFSPDDYIEFLKKEKIACSGTIGSIVMNCNPFTFGHKYLIERAIEKCDFLYIFVVEEDKSFFPFSDRLSLVKAEMSGFPNVKVLPSGQYIISSITLPEYFVKEDKKDAVIDASKDIRIFATAIAPCLNISRRFVGEEPFDMITNQYNEAMIETLPRYGIEVFEIPRKLSPDGNPISASRVRKLLDARNFEEISKLVPQTTLDYLEKKNGSYGKLE
jgi:[citrate (pro-3S)-lyase] ligase